MRVFVRFAVGDEVLFRKQLLAEVMEQEIGSLMETFTEASDDCFESSQCPVIASFGVISRVDSTLEYVRQKFVEVNDWLFGYIAYDYKNHLESLKSEGIDCIGYDDLCFVQPRYILIKENDDWLLGYFDSVDSELTAIEWLVNIQKPIVDDHLHVNEVELKQRVSKEEYLSAVEGIKEHIVRGDIYEMNYCTEFYCDNAHVDVVDVYCRLTKVSPMPFSVFMKLGDRFMMCASPERYIKKIGSDLLSQPIKGTSRRDVSEEEDSELALMLSKDIKERSENVMIADLVRNDLSKIAKSGSVHVKELCGVYSFKQVHQMITSIGATLHDDLDWIDAIEATFPMGSMTGAPKVSAMELIEQFEITKRGLYSGTVGYVTPEGDFDFNVVIRTIFYNRDNHYLSYITGSAITHLCNPEQEYEECLLKGKAMRDVLKGDV